jgi:hypothetical protein
MLWATTSAIQYLNRSVQLAFVKIITNAKSGTRHATNKLPNAIITPHSRALFLTLLNVIPFLKDGFVSVAAQYGIVRSCH